MSAASTKPVKLQVNTSGAWRDVISFDAAQDLEAGEVMAAAATLGLVAKAQFRVVIPNEDQPRSPTVLTRWSPEAGWEQRP
jgi:hypothetical protein